MSGLPVSPLIAQCALNPVADPSCGCLLSGGGPAMNTDISGPGVRISFYLQALFLACLSVRSGSLDEITSALYTSVATNIAMAVTSLILGFKPSPGISFHDAIVVLYLLALSWASVFFSLVSYNRFVKGDRSLKYFSILQSYILFAFAIAVLRTAPHFGYAAPCNAHAVVVIFRPFRALHTGVNAAWVLVTVTILVYTVSTSTDYMPFARMWYMKITRRRRLSRQCTLDSAELGEAGRGTSSAGVSSGVSGRASSCANVAEVKNKKMKKMKKKKTRGKHGDTSSTRKAACVSRDIVIKLAIILILWALAVLNIELLIIKNNFLDNAGTSSEWQFGQILAMFLVVLPTVSMIKTFNRYKLQPRIHRQRTHKTHTHSHKRRVHVTRSNLAHAGSGDGASRDFVGRGGGLRGGSGGIQPSFFWGPPFPNGAVRTARISVHSIQSAYSAPSVHSSTEVESSSPRSVRLPDGGCSSPAEDECLYVN